MDFKTAIELDRILKEANPGCQASLLEYRLNKMNLRFIPSVYMDRLQNDKYIELTTHEGKRWYLMTLEGRIILKSGGYLLKIFRDGAKTFLTYSISVSVCVATVFGAYYASKETDVLRMQYEIQLKETTQEQIQRSLIEQLKKQQQLINQLSNKICPQPTVVVKNQIINK
jgi:hypothetical protein